MSIEKISSERRERREFQRQQKAALRALIREDRSTNKEEYWGRRGIFTLLVVGGAMPVGAIFGIPVRAIFPDELGLALGAASIPMAVALAAMTKCDRLTYLDRAREMDEERSLASVVQREAIEASSQG